MVTTCATCLSCGERSAALQLVTRDGIIFSQWVCVDCALVTFKQLLHKRGVPVGLDITVTRRADEGGTPVAVEL